MSTPQCHEINVMTFDAECREICFVGRKTNVMTLMSWDLENVMRFIFSGTGPWTPHVDYIFKKANQKLGFLRHNLRGSPVSSKCLAYTSLVRSGLEYAAPIWDPITDKDSWKIESIQRRAARWAKSTYSPRASVTELLQELGWDDLSNRSKNLRLTLLYKIYYHQVAVDYAELDITHNPRPSRQHEHQIRQLPARKNTFLYSFVTRTIPEWNSLPANTISADSATTFKSQLPAATPWAALPRSRVGHLWHWGTIVQIQIQIQTDPAKLPQPTRSQTGKPE